MPSIEQLERLESLDPTDPFLPYAKALELAKAADHAGAIAAFDRCLELDPDYLYAYFHKARSQDALGRRTEAAESLTRGVDKAVAAGDAKAQSEMAGYLAELR